MPVICKRDPRKDLLRLFYVLPHSHRRELGMGEGRERQKGGREGKGGNDEMEDKNKERGREKGRGREIERGGKDGRKKDRGGGGDK